MPLVGSCHDVRFDGAGDAFCCLAVGGRFLLLCLLLCQHFPGLELAVLFGVGVRVRVLGVVVSFALGEGVYFPVAGELGSPEVGDAGLDLVDTSDELAWELCGVCEQERGGSVAHQLKLGELAVEPGGRLRYRLGGPPVVAHAVLRERPVERLGDGAVVPIGGAVERLEHWLPEGLLGADVEADAVFGNGLGQYFGHCLDGGVQLLSDGVDVVGETGGGAAGGGRWHAVFSVEVLHPLGYVEVQCVRVVAGGHDAVEHADERCLVADVDRLLDLLLC